MADAYVKNSLYVKNLSPQVTETVLREVFEPHDKIDKITFRAYPNSNNQFFAQIDFRTSTGVSEGSKLTGTNILGVACSCGVIDPITSDKQLQIAAGQQSDLAGAVDNPNLQLEIFNRELKLEAEDRRLKTVEISGFVGEPPSEQAVRRLCSNFGDVAGARVEKDLNGATFALVEFFERGVAASVKMQKTFKVDSMTLKVGEAKSLVDDVDMVEKGVQFQAPVLDAINMGTVLQMQGLLKSKLDKVKEAAAEMAAKAKADSRPAEDGASAAAAAVPGSMASPGAEGPDAEGAAEGPAVEPEGKKRKLKEKKEKKVKEKKKKEAAGGGEEDEKAQRRKKAKKEKAKKEKAKKEKLKAKKKKEKLKAKKKEAKKAVLQACRKKAASASAAMKSDDVQERFDGCVALRMVGSIAGRYIEVLENVLEDDDVDVREAATETLKLLGEAGFLQAKYRRKAGASESSAEESEEESTADGGEVESSGGGPVDLVDEVEMVDNTELVVMGDTSSNSTLSSDSDEDSSVAALGPGPSPPLRSPPVRSLGGGLAPRPGGLRPVVPARGAPAPLKVLKGSFNLDSDEDSPL